MKLWRILCGLWMVFIFIVSLWPPAPQDHPSLRQQMVHNFMHIPAYALLTYLIVRSFPFIEIRTTLYACGISLAYGGFMEILQSFVPGRECSLGDMGRNLSGALLAGLYVRFIHFGRLTSVNSRKENL